MTTKAILLILESILWTAAFFLTIAWFGWGMFLILNLWFFANNLGSRRK